MYNQRNLDFFSSFSFSEGELSRVANVWGEYLHENLQEELCQSKYSLVVDNSTIAGKNICAIEARYIKHNLIADQIVESSKTSVGNFFFIWYRKTLAPFFTSDTRET